MLGTYHRFVNHPNRQFHTENDILYFQIILEFNNLQSKPTDIIQGNSYFCQQIEL